MSNKFIFLNITVLFFALNNCTNSKKSSDKFVSTATLKKITVCHILQGESFCNQTRVYFYIKVFNGSNKAVQINKGSRKNFCYWNYLHTDIVIKSKTQKKVILELGVPNSYVIKPQSTIVIEGVLLNKPFYSSSSLKEIRGRIKNWLEDDCVFDSKDFRNIRFDKSAYVENFTLDGRRVSLSDSINFNKISCITLEDLKKIQENRK